jgi:hypothetical protein
VSLAEATSDFLGQEGGHGLVWLRLCGFELSSRHPARLRSLVDLMIVPSDGVAVFEHWLDEMISIWEKIGVFSGLMEIQKGNQYVLTQNGHDSDERRKEERSHDQEHLRQLEPYWDTGLGHDEAALYLFCSRGGSPWVGHIETGRHPAMVYA